MEVGNRVVVDGVEANVVGRHASGKHVNWQLSDGRVITDLHLRGDVGVAKEEKKSDAKRRVWKHEPLPRVSTDDEKDSA
jgi:hypothetical protein